MALVRWVFTDLVAAETYTFAINPGDGATPAVQKTLAKRQTTAPDGRTLIWEGADKPQDLNWSGVILTEAHLDALTLWAEKRHQIQVTDDLSRTFSIYVEEFVPTRASKVSHPWRHTYTIKATVVDWPI